MHFLPQSCGSFNIYFFTSFWQLKNSKVSASGLRAISSIVDQCLHMLAKLDPELP